MPYSNPNYNQSYKQAINQRRDTLYSLTGHFLLMSASWTDNFLPQAGLVYDATVNSQLFASYSENIALPRGADDVFRAASANVPAPAAETSKNYEVGCRLNRPTFNAAWALYRAEFDNRLQAFASPVAGSSTAETYYPSFATPTQRPLKEASYKGAIWYISISFIAMNILGMFDAQAKPCRSQIRQGA
jgi:outer membrane receptor protein involved in Fe transport